MSIKSKLLEAVGTVDIADIGNEALVDILVSKICALEKTIQQLHGENAAERERLYREIEAAKRDRNEMRSNPLYGAHGEFYFLGLDDRRYQLIMQGGQI